MRETYTLTDEDRAALRILVEKGKDDHYYGAWRGGKAASGGGPAGEPGEAGKWDDALDADVAAAVTAYTDSAYIPVNNYLREQYDGVVPAFASDAERAAGIRKAKERAEAEGVGKQVALLQRAVRPTPEPMTLYRGSDPTSLGFRLNTTPEAMLAGVKVGDVRADKGFTSAALSTQNLFWGGNTVRIELAAPKGTQAVNVAKLAKFPGEKEVLLAPGTNWRVVSASVQPASTMGGMSSPAHLLIKAEVVP